MAVASIRILETNPPQIEVTDAAGLKARRSLMEAEVHQLAEDALVILTKLAAKRGR